MLERILSALASMRLGSIKLESVELKSRLQTCLADYGRDLRQAPARLKERLPRSLTHWLSATILWSVFLWFAYTWVSGHWGFLFDPNQQTDDVRTSLIGFHQYTPEGTLGNDRIAKEMLSYAPPGVWFLYRGLVPVFGVYASSKIAQGLCFLFIVGAGLFLAGARRGSLAAGLLLIFIFFYTVFVKDRINSGLSRGFGFPALAWWIAGALCQSGGARAFGALLSAPFYPPGTAIILAAEGLYRLVPILPFKATLRRLAGYAVLVAACLLVVAPSVIGGPEARGPIHTLEEAKRDPAFGRRGRLYVLPFSNPARITGDRVASPLFGYGEPLVELFQRYSDYERTFALVGLALLGALCMVRLSPAPLSFAGILFGSLALYLLARLLAFRLYSPLRFLDYGAPAATFALVAGSLGYVFHEQRGRLRPVAQNAAGAAFIAFMLTVVGNGVEKETCCIHREPNGPLYDYIQTLPKSARFAAHIVDASDIPYWAARAVTASKETLQPWFVDDWRRQRRRGEDTTRAMYATDPALLRRFVHQYEVSHFLVNLARYRSNFRTQSRSFEPLTAYALRLLRNVGQQDLLFAYVPTEAVAFKHGRFLVVDARKFLKSLERRRAPARR
jgi:hypothetical protein